MIGVLGVSVVLRAGECPKAKTHGREKRGDIPTILNHRAGIELKNAPCQLSISVSSQIPTDAVMSQYAQKLPIPNCTITVCTWKRTAISPIEMVRESEVDEVQLTRGCR